MGLSFSFGRDSRLSKNGACRCPDRGMSPLVSLVHLRGRTAMSPKLRVVLKNVSRGPLGGSIQAISARLHGRSLYTSAVRASFQRAPNSGHQHRIKLRRTSVAYSLPGIGRNQYRRRRNDALDSKANNCTISCSQHLCLGSFGDQSHRGYNSFFQRAPKHLHELPVGEKTFPSPLVTLTIQM
jgi:hypothetical protein